MPRLCTRFFAVHSALFALALLTVSNAHAYDNQASADLGLGYAHLGPHAPIPGSGSSLSLGAGYGLGDMFTLRASLGYGLHTGDGQKASVGIARTEVAYMLDVLQVVPFFGAGASAWMFKDGKDTAIAPAAHLLLGMDYLITREWTAGVDVRIGMLASGRDIYNTIEAQLRLSRMFDLL
jgi:hypothetical protein